MKNAPDLIVEQTKLACKRTVVFVNSTFDVMFDIDKLIMFAPASVATAFASIVLPVPGGPKSSIPFTGCQKAMC